MSVIKIKVSAVSYTNTKPFLYGLKHSGILDKVELSLDIPSDCAKKLINNEVDIGLIPIAALLSIPNYKIISEYCIGSDGPVNSVFIFSNKPIEEVKTIRLDNESRTSNALARVLIQKYWNCNPAFIYSGAADAYIEIGDRTFGKINQAAFVYDLAGEWKKFTGLPFAFAVWASNKNLSEQFLKEFNDALKFGVNNIPAVLSELPTRDDFDLTDYLTHKLDFLLDNSKRLAIDKFLSYIKELRT